MSIIKDNKKDNKKRNVVLAILSTLLITGIVILMFFLLGRCSNSSNNDNNSGAQENYENSYNKLLSLVNSNINTTKVIDEESANEIISFSYDDNHFNISAVNDELLYIYDIDLNQSFADTYQAYRYIVDNDINDDDYLISLIRLNKVEDNNFVNTYIPSNYIGKYQVGSILSKKYASFTILLDDDIKVLNNIELPTSETPINIDKNNSLFGIYEYICKA